jgi:hypothetical protein
VEPISVDEPTLVGPVPANPTSEAPQVDSEGRRTEAAESIAHAADSIAHAADSISTAAETFAVEGEVEVEEHEPSDDDAEHYESWSKKKLLAAATDRGLEVKHGMTKADLVLALRAAS